MKSCSSNLRSLNNLYYNILGCAKVNNNIFKGTCQIIASRYSQIFCSKGICLTNFASSSNCLFTNFYIAKFVSYIQNCCLFIYFRSLASFLSYFYVYGVILTEVYITCNAKLIASRYCFKNACVEVCFIC